MRRYITPELYKFLDVGHLCDTFVVNSLEDIAPLKEASGMYNIRLPHIIQYTFANSLNDVGTLVPGYEQISVPFVIVFLPYGKKTIVSGLLLLSSFVNILIWQTFVNVL